MISWSDPDEGTLQGAEKPKKLGKKVAQKSLKEKRAAKKAKKSSGSSYS